MYKDKLYKETTPPLKELQNKRKKESREKSVSKSQNVKRTIISVLKLKTF
jgi:predicted Holliday junction resolvase-like endonuclease